MSALPKFLRHSSQDEPGFSRRRRGRGFSYHDVDGSLITCERTRARIDALGLPPAYEDVWICRDAHGHLQAAGTDARGRRQYRYHADWRAYRDARKFDRLVDFGRALPRLRTRIEADLKRNAPDAAQVTAALIRLIDDGAMRVGSPRYAQENRTYGASTLLSSHLKLDGPTLRLSYKAKGGKRVRKQIKDRTLARVLNRIDDLPGREIFTCLGADGDVHPIRSEDVNRYIAEVSGEEGMTAKTFRTWHGSVTALDQAVTDGESLTIKALSEAAAARLHNTPSIARNSYIHPDVIALAEMDERDRTKRLDALDLRRAPNGLSTEEKRLIALLA